MRRAPAIAVLLLFAAAPAPGQQPDRSGVEECLYSSFEQCQATLSGIGGSCVQNWYPRPVGERRRHGHNRWWPFYPD